MEPSIDPRHLNMLFLFGLLAVWYFLYFRPQQKQQRAHQELINSLKKNDEVVTASGIHATVIAVKEKTFILRVDENAKIEIDKQAIAYVKKVRQQ